MSYIRNRRDGSTCGSTDKGEHGCGSCRKKYDNGGGCGCNSTTDGRRRRRRSSKRSKRRSKRRSRRSRRRRS